MAMFRTFLAVPLPAALQQNLTDLQQVLAGRVRDVRWTRPGTLHLTLRFFGDVTQEDLEKLKVSVLSVKRIQRAFEVATKGLGAFPDPRRPRVLWIGLQPTAPLLELYRNCQTALLQEGFAPEPRPFKPHLTLGRLRQRSRDLTALVSEMQGQVFGSLPIGQLVLYQSRLLRNGAEHIPLLSVDLPGEDAD